jgi:hypothetical protein
MIFLIIGNYKNILFIRPNKHKSSAAALSVLAFLSETPYNACISQGGASLFGYPKSHRPVRALVARVKPTPTYNWKRI